MAKDVFGIVGTVVGGAFNVEAVVAEGGFAVVYRAYHGAFHAPVALKCLKVPSFRHANRLGFLERFREEGEVMFRLSQSIPTVVRPLHIDAFETSQGEFVPYMALEWLDGETLDVVIARRAQAGQPPMNAEEMFRLLTPVARALARAHKFPGPHGTMSIVHRDLKPDNILVAVVNGEEVIKILDFGIAKVKSAASQVAGRVSQEGGGTGVAFTPGYAAPEQWFPKRFGQTGPWTDVWGLALTGVEVLAGRPVIDGDHAAMMGTAVDEHRRPTPRSEGVSVSDGIEAVFLEALAVDPRARFQDVGEFWSCLEAAVEIGQPLGSTGATAMGELPPRIDLRMADLPPVLGGVFETAGNLAPPSQRSKVAGSGSAMGRPSRLQVGAQPVVGLDIGSSGLTGAGAGARAESVPVPDVPDLDVGPTSKGSLELVGTERAKVRGQSPSGLSPRIDSTQPVTDNLELDLAEASRTEVEPGVDRKGDGIDAPVAGLVSAAHVREKPTDEGHEAPAKAQAAKASSGAAESVAVPVIPFVEGSQSGGAADIKVDLRASGLDLAVKPEAVRRTASGTMKAVSAAMLTDDAAVGRVSARNGVHQAMGTPAPIGRAQPVSLQPRRKLGVPIALVAVGLVLAVMFYVNASMGGGKWAIGGVMPVNWIAGILVVVGTALLLIRIFWPEE